MTREAAQVLMAALILVAAGFCFKSQHGWFGCVALGIGVVLLPLPPSRLR